MPPPPGMSPEEYAKLKAKQAGGSSSSSGAKKDPAKEAAAAKAKEDAEKRKAYLKRADPATVEDLVGADKLQEDFFEEGKWKPAWSNIEFVSGFSTSEQLGLSCPSVRLVIAES